MPVLRSASGDGGVVRSVTGGGDSDGGDGGGDSGGVPAGCLACPLPFLLFLPFLLTHYYIPRGAFVIFLHNQSINLVNLIFSRLIKNKPRSAVVSVDTSIPHRAYVWVKERTRSSVNAEPPAKSSDDANARAASEQQSRSARQAFAKSGFAVPSGSGKTAVESTTVESAKSKPATPTGQHWKVFRAPQHYQYQRRMLVPMLQREVNSTNRKKTVL